MSVTISARSPVLAYTPCVDCIPDGGWTVKEGQMEGLDGRLAVGFNFTGTGFSYQFSTAPSDQWKPILTINGSAPPSTSDQLYGRSGLPPGTHSVQLALTPPQPDPFSNETIAPSTFGGITIDTGLVASSSSRNVTIDDTAWRNGSVLLSPGWNMMESEQNGTQSNWINDTQIEQERQTRGRNYNESLSWTEQRRANTTVLFEGEQVWVYGLSGGEAGMYEVSVDGVVKGRYNGAGGTRVYGSLLYTTNLPSGRHNLTLSNLEEGKRLSFDRLVAINGLKSSPPSPSSTPSPSSPPTPTPSPKGLSPGAVTGVIIGVIVGLATVIPIVLFLLRQRQRKKRRGEDDLRIEKDGPEPGTFFKWPNSSSHSSKKDTKGSWFRLPDRNVSPNPASDGVDAPQTFSLGSTTQDADSSARGGLFKLPNALRKSGTWSFGNAHSERSFMSDLGSPSTPTHGQPHGHVARFRAATEGRPDSPSSFFSFNGKGSKKPDFMISNPIPMTTTTGGGDVAEDSMTPAMAAAVNGRTMSPLAQIKNHALAADSKLMPIGLGTNMDTAERFKVGRAI